MRRRLTPAFVDALRPPRKGEVWIADVAVPGFGIRAWDGRTKFKTFAIRAVDKDGKKVRMNICDADGRLLEYARGIAIKQLLILKGHIDKLSSTQRLEISVPRLSLSEWMARIFELKRREGANPNYIEQLQELYANYADPQIGQMRLAELTLEEVRSCVRGLSKLPSQARKLQSLLHLSLEFAGRFCDACAGIAYQLTEESNFDYYPYGAPSFGLTTEDFKPLFEKLTFDQANRQLALFIMGVLLLGVRPKELLRSKWDQISDGYFTPLRRAEWRRFIDRILIDELLDWYFQEVRKQCDIINPGSDFLFPSNKSLKTGHLTSYQKYWNALRHEFGFPNEQLFHIARHLRNPKYYEMRQWGFGPYTIKAVYHGLLANEAKMSTRDTTLRGAPSSD